VIVTPEKIKSSPELLFDQTDYALLCERYLTESRQIRGQRKRVLEYINASRKK
jgi:hypothetical protein